MSCASLFSAFSLRSSASFFCALLLVNAYPATGQTQARGKKSATCDLSPLDFPGQSFSKSMKYFIGGDKVLNPDLVLSDTVFTFGQPRSVPGLEHMVVDISVKMDFSAQGVVKKWYDQVNGITDVGCSSTTVWFPNPAWQIEQGAWVGRFHVKHVDRACWFFQIDRATYETDFWNRVGIKVAPDGSKIDPDYANGSSSNVPDLVKVIAQGLGAIAQIVSLGFVPQANVQAIDGGQKIDEALSTMSQIEQSELTSTKAAGPQEKAGFKLNFLFTGGGFRQDGTTPILFVVSSQDPANPPNRSEACTIRESLSEMQIGGTNVGSDGKDYTVEPGDSLWGIAKKFYGNGHYHLLIAAANDIPITEMNRLSKGRKLRLQPVSAYRSRGDILLVKRGDNLWKLASQSPSGTVLFTALKNVNSASLPDPNRIYPIQILRVPPSGQTKQVPKS